MAVATPAPERAAGRRRLARQSKALPDGSFPIPNVSYLKKAIRAVGRASAGKRPAIARLIRKRARQLGAWNVVKGSWADNAQSAKAMAHALNGQLIELGFSPELAKAETQATMAFMLREFAAPVTSSTDGPRVTTLASGGGRKKRYDPDNDGDLYHGSTDIGAGAANFANEAPGVVELVRHVRSPAGVAFFKKPIGTPITEAEYDAIKAEHAAAMRSHAADLRGSGNSSAASALERAAESVQRSRATSPGTLSRANEQLYNASAALGRDMSQSDKQRIAQEHIENVESLGRYSRLGTPFELPGDRTAEAKSRGRQATSAREVRPADSRSEFLAAASMPSEAQLKAADNYDAYGFPLKKSVSEPSKESSSAHSDLLAARKAARAKYPAGHPERLKAERAVRQSRKSRRQGSGSTESQAHVSETKKAAEAKKDPGFYSPKSSTSGIASFRDIRQQNARTTEEANKYGGVESLASNELSRYWSMRNAGASHETAMRNIHRARKKKG